jgi:Zn-dependent protease
MRAKSLKLGRFAGIPLYVDPIWPLIFAGMAWILADAYLPGAFEAAPATYWLLGVATTLLFFGAVLLHELGHALIARAQGAQVRRITLLFFGGLAEMDSTPTRARDELASALAGPAVTLATGLLFGLVYTLTRPVSPIIAAPARFLQVANIGLGLFNLLPGLPLDGGRILRAALWALDHDANWATRQAARAGQWVGILIMSLGVLLTVREDVNAGILTALVGLSLHHAARTAYHQAGVQGALQGYVVSDLMQDHSAMLDPHLTLDRLPAELLMGDSSRYLVGDRGHVLGLVSLRHLRKVPQARWERTRLAETLTPWDEIEPVSPEMPLDRALQRMAGSNMAQLPVMADGALQGILSRRRIIAFVEMRSQAGAGE